MHTLYFISHPDVEIDPAIPVPEWPLSTFGKSRMKQLLNHAWVQELTAVYSSDEQKARDGAEIMAAHLGLSYTAVTDLGENDRSATGFLKPAEFELTADAFFASPDKSVRGWETAIAAQDRIVNAIARIDRDDATDGPIAIVSHGAVGTLLYCHLARTPIDRRWDQPGQGGGNFMQLTMGPNGMCTWWEAID